MGMHIFKNICLFIWLPHILVLACGSFLKLIFLIFIFTLFYFTILYWFCHMLTWILHGCTWVPNPEPPSHLPLPIISLDNPCAPAPSILYPVSNCFLTSIQVSQEAGKVTWYSYLFKNFPQFVVIHKVKDFRVVNEAEVDAFLELPCFLHDPVNVGNLISTSSASSKSMLFSGNTSGSSWFMICWSLAWRFWALPSSMWNKHNCTVVWTFFSIALLWDWNENKYFPVLWPVGKYLPDVFVKPWEKITGKRNNN